MKYPQIVRTVLVNRLDQVMKKKNISNSELSRISGVARPTIIRLRSDVHQDWRAGTMNKISNALCVPMTSLYREIRSFEPKDDPNGFSTENLAVLDKCLQNHALSLNYLVYGEQGKMNVWSKYQGNSRVSFRGNWQFHDGIDSKIVLIDCDVRRNRMSATSHDVETLFDAIIASVVEYAKRLTIKSVVYPLPYQAVSTQQGKDADRLLKSLVRHGFDLSSHWGKPALTLNLSNTKAR